MVRYIIIFSMCKKWLLHNANWKQPIQNEVYACKIICTATIDNFHFIFLCVFVFSLILTVSITTGLNVLHMFLGQKICLFLLGNLPMVWFLVQQIRASEGKPGCHWHSGQWEKRKISTDCGGRRKWAIRAQKGIVTWVVF